MRVCRVSFRPAAALSGAAVAAFVVLSTASLAQTGGSDAAGDTAADAGLLGLKGSLGIPGVELGLQEQSEVWSNFRGGGKQGLSYNGLTTASLKVDLDKTAGWPGGQFFVDVFDIHGHGPSRSFVGNQQLVSNIEAAPSIKLYDLWLEQKLLDGRVSLRLGQEGANDELMITAYGATFLNSSFGFPGLPAADLPSGGPNYPLATPFLRLELKPAEHWTLVGAVYNGDPAPAGPGDPQIRDRNGTAFRLDDHALAFAEIRYAPGGDNDALPTRYKLGAWYASNHFADQRRASGGGLLADPSGSGMPLQHTGDYAVYAIVDQSLWHRPDHPDQGIGAFLQIMGAPSDRNLSNLFIEAGLNWHAPFPERADDVAGIAVSYLGISPAARSFSRDLVAFGRAASAYAASETVLEATYIAPATPWLSLQPDLQLVLNPGAGIPGPFGRRPLGDALVAGIRATAKF